MRRGAADTSHFGPILGSEWAAFALGQNGTSSRGAGEAARGATLPAMSPYREAAFAPRERDRSVDPWLLALLFAWVADAGRIGLGWVDGRPVTGELGFAALLAVTTAIALGARWRMRREDRAR
jgi:hypothetical protein